MTARWGVKASGPGVPQGRVVPHNHRNDVFGHDIEGQQKASWHLPLPGFLPSTLSLRAKSSTGSVRWVRWADSLRVPALIVAAVAVLGIELPAHAQGRLDARYVVTLAGLPIGKGAWVIDIGEDQYTAAASGTTTGLLRVFSSGQGTGAARGHIIGGTPVPATFAASITADKRTDETRISIVSGHVKDFRVDPPVDPDPERVPVTDAHRVGVTDPMTGSLIRVPGNGDPLRPEACNRVIPVFDGRLRYDLKLAYKRTEQVKAEKGYQGPAIVCAVYFVPLAGYVPSRKTVKYLIEQRNMEIWLVPIAATRVLVPFRIAIPTPIGLGVLQATQFVSAAQPARATALPRTQ